jgi:hypothetical protein
MFPGWLLIIAWFAANAFIATITPVKDGGIPHYAELKLVFKEGGAFEFYNTYTALLDRLQSQGDGAPVEHLEDLPVYSRDGSVGPPPPATRSALEDVDEMPLPVEAGGDVPEEMPPAYDDVASEDGERGRSRTPRGY